jgi:protein tyrosine/serine phosphatase
MKNRQLNWEGCNNIRDLGGLPTADGRRTRWGALVRADDPGKLTPSGWQALWDHGIRTIISLFTEGQPKFLFDPQVLPPGIDLLSVAIEDLRDTEFVKVWASTDLWCTPLYYQDALKRWPERHAIVFSAFVHAQPGGVLFHCARGIDRTGIIALLFLALAGVSENDILADYEQSLDPERDHILHTRNTSTRDVILKTIKNLNAEAYLLSAGLNHAEIKAVKERFLEPLTDTDNIG